MMPIVPERLPEFWQTGHLHLDPHEISCVPRRIAVGLAAVSVVTGELVVVTLGVFTWNALASLRNRMAASG